jgi:hypothetical protein
MVPITVPIAQRKVTRRSRHAEPRAHGLTAAGSPRKPCAGPCLGTVIGTETHPREESRNGSGLPTRARLWKIVIETAASMGQT